MLPYLISQNVFAYLPEKHQHLNVSVYLLSTFSAILRASGFLCHIFTKKRLIYVYEALLNTTKMINFLSKSSFFLGVF